MLAFDHLTKAYGGTPLFAGLRHAFPTGVFALQGANGIGKSTLLAILAGAQEADAGAVWVAGKSLHAEPMAARARLAYVPDASPVYPFMQGGELLAFVAAVKRTEVRPEVWALAEALGLAGLMARPFGKLSLGTQKKFLLCAAWIGAPSVLLLDEPSNALDQAARQLLAARLREVGSRATVLFSSHDAAFVAATGAEVVSFEGLLAEAQGDEG